MGKYSALGRHLKGLDENEISLSFNEVEEILGFDLPKSARKHRPWWANDDSHVQARDGWLRYGWKSQNIDMRKETVEFARSEDRAEAVLEHENVERGVTSEMTGAEFEEIARRVMEDYLDVDLLTPRQIEDLPKLFDFVSEDRNVIGEAKFFSMVRGEKIPPAKFSAIAEHAWLLEKVDAEEKFLVFGRDRRVPEEWLKRYGPLVDDIDIYFIDEEGSVSKLNKDVKHAPN